MNPKPSSLSSKSKAVREATNLLPTPGAKTWTLWATHSQWAPQGQIESVPGPRELSGEVHPALSLHCAHAEGYGSWRAMAHGIVADRFYEFSVWQRTEGTEFDNVQVPLVLSWMRADQNSPAIQRDYVDEYDSTTAETSGGWVRRVRRLRAPDEAVSVRVDLGLRWMRGASAWWMAPWIVEVPPPPARRVRIATTRIEPHHISTIALNTQAMAEMLDRLAPERPDLVLFSENLLDRFVHEPLSQTAQTIPGPFTEMLSEKARKLNAYIVAGLHEKDAEGRIYTTAVLVDRNGNIATRYRKMHLTLMEAEAGILPGHEPVVFETDFGKVGFLICWDNWFAESARLLRLKGAEILLLPIAGDGVPGHWETISRARALDNAVYLVASGTVSETPSCIINPAGEVLGRATGPLDYVVKEIDLNRQWYHRYLSIGPGMGHARSLYLHERRPDAYGPVSQSQK